MAHGIKFDGITMKDAQDFANLPKRRNAVIDAAPTKEISGIFPINEHAKALHPEKQALVIKEIIDHTDAKTYILSSKDGSPVAYFRAGQYLSVQMNIEGSLLTRPYSISSSPAWANEGKYAITIRRNPAGFAADKFLDSAKVGDDIITSGPEGNFYYDAIRDAGTVIALAGGSGITPFLSMAYAIRDGLEKFNLTIIFGSRTEDTILFKKELDEITAACPKVKVVHVLSNEEKEGYEHGFITAEIIKKYAPDKYSIFMCGPEAMYRFAEKEISALGLEKKFVRRELLGVTKKVSEQPGYPADAAGKVFNLTVLRGEEKYEIKAKAEESVLVAIERAGINAPSRCRSGECGWCRSKLVSGSVYTPEETDGRRHIDKKYNYIHPCASFPTSDLVVEVPGSYLK